MRKICLNAAILISVLFFTSILHSQWVDRSYNTSAKLTDVIMFDDTTAIVVGQDRSILRTTDAGKTWLDIAAPLSYTQPWYSISFFDKDNGVVAGTHGTVLTTNNGGLNWLWHSINTDRECLSSLQIGPGNIYIGTDSGFVFHSLDTGKTWVSEKISEGSIRALFAWRGAYVMSLPIYALTPYSICSATVFPSGPWSEKILSVFLGLGSEAFNGEYAYSGGPCFLVGAQGDFVWSPTIARKTLTDTSWQIVPLDFYGIGAFYGVSVPSETVAYACGSGGMVVKSSDGGDSWKLIKVPSEINLNAIYFYNNDHGFAVGDSGTIFYTSNGVITAIAGNGNKLPEKFSLKQNYPNPFNPSTTISFDLPYNSKVSLVIYDALGRKVTELISGELNAGSHSVKWNAGNHSSGVYFYRLQTESFSQTKKLILLK